MLTPVDLVPAGRIRTPDLLFTKQLLLPLSYAGETGAIGGS